MIELELHGCHVLFTASADGDVREADARARLAAHARRPLALGRQVHGTVVARVGSAAGAARGAGEEADGLATAARDVAPAVLVADCLPVAVVGRGAVAMVHAGWRGLAGGVLEEGVRAVAELSGSDPPAAVIGPAAGPCCYEVGDDLRELFGTAGRTLDMKGIALERLRAAGIAAVDDVGCCTVCDSRFFSYRREGDAAGRQAGVAWLTR